MMKDGLQVGQCGLGANKTEKLFRENRKRHAARKMVSSLNNQLARRGLPGPKYRDTSTLF